MKVTAWTIKQFQSKQLVLFSMYITDFQLHAHGNVIFDQHCKQCHSPTPSYQISQQTKCEWNWIQPDNYYSFDLSHLCSSNKSIRKKHAVLALNSVLVYYCQHLNDGKSRDIKMASPINYVRGLCILTVVSCWWLLAWSPEPSGGIPGAGLWWPLLYAQANSLSHPKFWFLWTV